MANDTPQEPAIHATLQRWVGAKNLLADAVEHGSRAVERSQRSVLRRVLAAVGAVSGRDDALTQHEEAVWSVLATGYRNVRLVTQLTSVALDVVHVLAEPLLQGRDGPVAPIPLRSDVVGTAPWLWDSFIGTANGLVGDHLAATDNHLAMSMTLRTEQTGVSNPPDTTPARVCVFVHGLAATEWSWAWDAEAQHGSPEVTYGSLLHKDLGFTPVYVRYNTGLHISDNGQQLAALLESWVTSLPAGAVEIAIVGHSLGGLVAHSAAHYGRAAGHGWIEKLKHVVSIAGPHDGAPLEKLGSVTASVLGAIDTPGTQIPAEVIEARSAGIRDLRHGYIVEEDWRDGDTEGPLTDGRTHTAPLEGAQYHHIGSTLTDDPDHPIGRLVGDYMVRPDSATAARSSRAGEVAMVGGISHIGLANHPRVYAHLRKWLAPQSADPMFG